ncbi:hypothetical protein PYCCODRAFT_1426295 [Trametes coccinea BRFM310]|uniref:Uncharacterized protein n=1 Tax=Trametes coccinea (strain BRFM310) TaxID=1353009 RepID=A0A1Y2IIE2_TRAC3|nr:hypothetical protein PYCCODRAFT_1426295 [Trametes coccinea BRFM310]
MPQCGSRRREAAPFVVNEHGSRLEARSARDGSADWLARLARCHASRRAGRGSIQGHSVVELMHDSGEQRDERPGGRAHGSARGRWGRERSVAAWSIYEIAGAWIHGHDGVGLQSRGTLFQTCGSPSQIPSAHTPIPDGSCGHGAVACKTRARVELGRRSSPKARRAVKERAKAEEHTAHSDRILGLPQQHVTSGITPDAMRTWVAWVAAGHWTRSGTHDVG